MKIQGDGSIIRRAVITTRRMISSTSTPSFSTTLLLVVCIVITGVHGFNVAAGGNRDKAAVESIQKALKKPRTDNFKLIEVAFPPLDALNKLGDGSFRSAQQVDKANIEFTSKLCQSLSSPFPFMMKSNNLQVVWCGSKSFTSTVQQKISKSGGNIWNPRDESTLSQNDIVIFVSPSNNNDYRTADELARTSDANGGVILINGFAKTPKSVSAQATMAYYYKPLTYNSMVAGVLERQYPNDWKCIETATGQILGSFSDDEILLPKTNTPDLRAAVKLVSTAFDQRAIEARKQNR